MQRRGTERPAWHTPHTAHDIGVINDAHRRALCAGASLTSGDMWLACEGDPSRALLQALASSQACGDGHTQDHGAGEVEVDGQVWAWRFEYFDTESLSAPADPANQQVFRLLIVGPRGPGAQGPQLSR
jgi:hypothetical protein